MPPPDIPQKPLGPLTLGQELLRGYEERLSESEERLRQYEEDRKREDERTLRKVFGLRDDDQRVIAAKKEIADRERAAEAQERTEDELVRRKLDEYKPTDPVAKARRAYVRQPMRAIPDPDIQADVGERREEIRRKTEGGILGGPEYGYVPKREIETPPTGPKETTPLNVGETFLDFATRLTKFASDPYTPIMEKAMGASEEEARGTSVGLAGGTGMAGGIKRGMDIAKLPIVPGWAKPLIPAAGGAIGKVVGEMAVADPPTPGKAAEGFVYSLGYNTILTQLPKMKVNLLSRMVVGGGEAALIAETAKQSREILDKGKSLEGAYQPWYKQFWDRNMYETLFGVALGPLLKAPEKGGKPKGYNWRDHVTDEQFEAKRTEVIDSKQADINHFQTLARARSGGKKKAAKSLVAKLKSDLKNIEANPTILFDVKDPVQTARTLYLLHLRKTLSDAAARGDAVNQKAAYNNAIEYLDSLGTGKALSELTKIGRSKDTPEAIAEAVGSLQAAMRKGKPYKSFSIAKVVPDLSYSEFKQDPKKYLKGLWDRDWSAIGPSDRPRGPIGKVMGMATTLGFKRFFMGTADVFEEAGRRSGAGKNSAAFRMARALRDSVDNGDFWSSEGRRLMMQEAENLGFYERANAGKAAQAGKEFEAYQQARHTGAKGVEYDPVTGKPIDVREGMVRKGVPGKLGRKEEGHVPVRPGESSDLTRGTVGENLQIDRARKIYNDSSLMGRALIDGFEKSAQKIAAKMDALEVIVIGPGKDGRLVGRRADTIRRYWPRHLKPKYEKALQNLFEENRHGELVHREAIGEMMAAMGIKGVSLKKGAAAIDKRFSDYLTAGKEANDPKNPLAGDLFSHVERMRTAEEFPPELLDWSLDLGVNYITKAQKRLAEIANFNQKHKLGKEIEGSPGLFSVSKNPNYLFTQMKGLAKDKFTKEYIDAVHNGIFEVSKGGWGTINRNMSGLMIANALSALRNSTGILNTWNVVSNKNFAKALTIQLADEFADLAQSVRGTRRRRPNTSLAENIGVTSKDIGKVVEMIENQPLSSLGKNTDDWVGKVLESPYWGGFSKVERVVRRQAVQSAQFNRADFLRLYDDNPQAKDLVDVIWDLKFDPSDKRLLAKLSDLTGRGKLKLRRPEQMLQNKRLAEHARFLTNLDINMNKIAAERFGNVMGKTVEVPINPANTPETTRYLQRFVREVQGGYRYDQLPVFMSNDMHKVFFKFMNWSQQMTRHFDRNVLAEATEGNYKPLLKWVAATQIAGETMGEVKKMFGQDRTDASYAEINAALNEDDYGKAAGMVLTRMGENAYLGGLWALFGDAVGGRIVRYTSSKVIDTPTVVIYDEGELIVDAIRRRLEGGDNKRLFEDLVRPVSGLHRGGQLLTELGVPIPKWRTPERQQYETSQRKMSGLAKRFIKDDPALWGGLGKEPQTGMTGRTLPLGDVYPFKRDLVVALASGDVEGAKELSDDYIAKELETRGWITAMVPQLYEKIEKSIRSHQPLKMGNTWSKENQKKVITYMDRVKWPHKKEILDYQKTYIDTAIAAGLLHPEEADTEEQKKADKAAFTNRVVSAFAEKFVSDRKDKSIPQALVDAERYYAKSEIRGLAAPAGPIGSKEGWPFSMEARLKTAERQAMSDKAHTRISGLLAKRLRDKALSEIMLNPEFIRIGSASGRAEFMVEEWDRQKKTQKEREKMLNDLAEQNFLDGRLLDDLPNYLDKSTLEHYYLILERRKPKK